MARKRPGANMTVCIDGTWHDAHFEYADDNETITAVYPDGEHTPPKDKPHWWQFWRLGEVDLYMRW